MPTPNQKTLRQTPVAANLQTKRMTWNKEGSEVLHYYIIIVWIQTPRTFNNAGTLEDHRYNWLIISNPPNQLMMSPNPDTRYVLFSLTLYHLVHMVILVSAIYVFWWSHKSNNTHIYHLIYTYRPCFGENHSHHSLPFDQSEMPRARWTSMPMVHALQSKALKLLKHDAGDV